MKIFTEHTNNESKGSLDISLMIFYMGREFTLRYVDERDKLGLDLAECNWNQHAKQILLPQLYSTVEFKVTLIKNLSRSSSGQSSHPQDKRSISNM